MNIDASIFYELLLLLIHINTPKTKALADEIFDIYNDNMSSVSSSNVNYCNLYVNLCKDVISQGLTVEDNKSDISNIIVRYLNNKLFNRDKLIKETLKDMLKSKVTTKRLADISEKLNNLVIWHKSNRYVNKLYGAVKEYNLVYTTEDQSAKILEMKDLVTQFKDTIMEIDSVVGKGGPVERIDFSKKSSIKNALNMFKERQVTNVIKTGLQGINKMCGSKGGFALGESVIFCALQHNFKSGMLKYMMRWIANYSIPTEVPNKKPLILFISFEDVGYMSMMKVFDQMYVALVGNPRPVDMSDEELVNEIYQYFNRGEYTIVIERYLPTQFGYDELVHLYEKYSAAGFNIIACLIDYLTLMKKGSGSYSKVGGDVLIQELCNNCCNFFKAVGTTLFTAAQLNRGASDLVGSNILHPVKQFSERHTAGSIGIGREFDFVIYLNIEKDEQGQSWLTMQWGKHRYVEDTPEVDKFVAYKFESYGIPDDVDSEFAGVRNIYTNDKKEDKVVYADIETILGIN